MASHQSDPADTSTPAPGVACCGVSTPVTAVDGTREQPVSEILIISDSCCNPAATPAEERAVKAVDEAITAIGASARSRVVSATEALGGALSPEILAKIQSHLVRGTARPPMVMIDGEIVASGNFTQQEVEAALTGRSGATG